MATIVRFSEIGKEDLERAGGKGANLGELSRAGFPVPAGFVVTTAAYRTFVAANGLEAAILEASRPASEGDPAAAETAAQTIRGLFERGTMPTEISEAIRQAAAELSRTHGEVPLAVRSSATAEDLPGASFAGQQETYLNVRGETALLDAVQRCWGSLWTARAIAYRARQGIDPGAVSLAVVVQQMVPAEAAGILFTANPVTGARDEVVINAAWGLGEAIVGGLVTPDDVIVDKASGQVKTATIAEKSVMTVSTAEGTEERPVPAGRRREAVLSPARAAELAGLGREIERHYGSPQDIEWCLADGKIYVVQARPITVLPPVPVRWEAPGPGLWAHGGGSIEMMTEPMSPLCETFLVPRINRYMHDWLERLGLADSLNWPLAKLVNGYIYVAMDIRFRLRQVPNWIRNFREHMDSIPRWSGELDQYRARVIELTTGPERGQLTAEALIDRTDKLAWATFHYWLYMMQVVQAIYRKEQDFMTFYQRTVRRPEDPEPEVLLRGQETRPLAAEFSVYELARWAETQPEVRAALAGPEPLAACQETAAGQEFLRRLEVHLAEFGHQIYSFDPLLPTLAGDPRPVLLAIQTAWEGQEDPRARQARMRAEQEAALARIEARLSEGKRARLRTLLAAAREAARLREDALFEVGLGWVPLRADLLELGRRMAAARALETPEDIFWIHAEELQSAVADLDAGQTPPAMQATVQERREYHAACEGLQPPYVLPEGRKAKFFWKWLIPTPELQNQEAGDRLTGLGVSPGKITAVARVIASPAEMGRLGQGEILVAHTTTPAWTPLFARAAALVTDLGGPLAHGSIVAREYGIPAVMGTGVATQRIRDGQTITVDGTTGRVELESEAGWILPDPRGLYGRGSITELLPDPMTPLFATLGLEIMNSATERMYRYIADMPRLRMNAMLININDYLYYRAKFSGGDWVMLGRAMFVGIPRMFGPGEHRWQDEMRPRYQALVDRWQARALPELKPAELYQGARELIDTGIESYTVLQSSLIPLSTMAEQLFSAFYRRIRRPDDPPALVYLVGYESIPIRAEKSLYDVAMGAQKSPELAAYLAQAPVTEIAAQLERREPPAGVAEPIWTEWRRRFQTHLEHYGHILYDLDFGKPVPLEDPVPLLDACKAYLAGRGSNPYARQQAAAERREAAVAAQLARLKGWKAKWFRKLFGWVEKYMPLREDGLADLGLGWPLLRRLLRELGRRLVAAGALAQPDDIFWLRQAELESAVAGLEQGGALPRHQETVAQRRADWRTKQQNLIPPPVLPDRPGFWKQVMDRVGSARMTGHTADTLKGVGASPGRITATARVLRGADDFVQMQPGEVLVAPITTPAWTPLFALASAIVTDVGGPLSHSSIVAREYGIPAVLGTGVATQRIHSGQTITVDGDTGTVRLA